MSDSPTVVELVLPCKDEAGALPSLLARVPDGYRVLVVDNGSRDGTAEVAARLGARVVAEERPGYGAAVHAGVVAADGPLVAVLDGDDSLDPTELPRLVAPVARGDADLAVGRRRPAARGAWPWHARLGNAVLAGQLRRRSGLPVHDIGPVRVFRRDALLALGVQDRRSGYPLELLLRAGRAGWRVVEHDVTYRPRAAGTRSKVSGSVRGTLTAVGDMAAVLR
jgi:glycosyltransferase involved in cell wall biosynthesis